MKTYYDLLSIERGADADTIKKAFRREIARYHPDKVIHLGAEFQEMAATRAAALTVAYKQLGDPVLRAQYDASIAVEPTGNDRDSPKPESPDIGPAEQPSVRRDVRTPPPPRTSGTSFRTMSSSRSVPCS